MKSKKTLSLLCIALVLILLGSILAGTFNGGKGTTKVTRISFETANGTLSGLLYMPKGASAENPKPTVIVTHGYLNSAEMQDANAIELSRRGFVVLALDQYDHGHSDLNDEVYTDTSFFGIWLPFWANSMNDAVQYMYDQPYVLKDENGNGMIGVTGHSMGGFSTTIALARDEQQFAESGVRKIHAGLTEGADFSYSAFVGVDAATADALGGGRFMGKVAAHYDEFFFNDPTVEGGSVRYKDYVATPDGMTFLQQTKPAQANTWYETSDGGMRIIYEPAQTHPWNHFSAETTGYAISFYEKAFADYADQLSGEAANQQVWQYKEAFECVALVGFVMLLVAVADLLITLPFFSQAKSGELAVQPSAKGGKKWGTWAVLLVAVLLPGIFFTPLMDGDAVLMNVLFYCSIVVAAGGVLALILNLTKAKAKGTTVAAVVMILSGALLAVVSKASLYANYAFWTAPGLNSIAKWTLGCTLISLCLLSTAYVLLKRNDGLGLAAYGLSFKPMVIVASLCVALVTLCVGYAVLFLMDALFKADFRIWTFAFKTFDANILPAVLRYLPTFLAFYFVSTIGITINTNTERCRGFWGYLLAIVLNAGGAILWLCRQYITLFQTGVAAHPGSALSGIVLVAMVPTLTIAAILSRNLYKRTGNVWTAAFLNGGLMTLMAVANTMVAFK